MPEMTQQAEALRLASIIETPKRPAADLRNRVAAMLRSQHARIAELENDLQFVERWAVHHGTKSSLSAKEALSAIQHYPSIVKITGSYADGKRPDTFNPYARIAELEQQLAAKCLVQISEPKEEAIIEITSAGHDAAEFGERAINLLRDFQHLDYGTLLYPHPPKESVAQGVEQLTQAARDVLAERARQVSAEGWTPDRDDVYTAKDLAMAAACYAISSVCCVKRNDPPIWWPWAKDWWKPTHGRRDLEKAGALILAEIERIDRAAAQAKQGGVANG